MILDSLRDQGDWQAILKLRLVNKHWLRLTEPYAFVPVCRDDYQAFKIEEEIEDVSEHSDDDWVDEDDEDITESPIPRTCFKLMEPNCRPDWFKVLPTSVPSNLLWPWADPEFTVENYKRLKQVFSKVDHVFPQRLSNTLMLKILAQHDIWNPDAQLATVLAICPNLEKIKEPDDEVHFGPLSREVFAHAAHQAQTPERAPVLGKLTHLEMNDIDAIEVAEVLDMLSLPKLQNLRLRRLIDVTDHESLGSLEPETKPRNQNAVHLTLQLCDDLSDEGLTMILGACPKIRSLFIDSVAASYTGALEKHGKNLEFLWLDAQRHGDIGLRYMPKEAERLLSAIGAMRNLRTLVLSRSDFDTIESLCSALPSSLREIAVFGCYSNEERLLFSETLGRTPSLPFLTLGYSFLGWIQFNWGWDEFEDYAIKKRCLPPPKQVSLLAPQSLSL